jgi:general nucleoside transport system ATP-binding protein
MAPVLELRGVTKSFPGVLANDRIDLTLNQGEIHALLGENGAGKTTLMNVLYGLYQPDSGEMFVHDRPAAIHSPSDAIARGIGMVHQHFMLVPVMTVTENVMLGVESVRGRVFLDPRKAAARIREISQKYGLDVDPDAYVKDLPVGVQQRVEIIKVLYREAEILVLDEPTAVITPQEVDDLFKVLRALCGQGKSLIFITHKLKEVMEVADRITVLRQGRVVGTTTPREASMETLARMMVGRGVDLTVHKAPAKPGNVVLEVQGLCIDDVSGAQAVRGVSFSVREGEILGVAGVQGNGQTKLVEAVTGLTSVSSGCIRIAGKDVTNASPRVIVERGVGHVPEDRQQDGLVLSFPIKDNLILNTYYLPPFARGLNMNEGAVIAAAGERAEAFDVRTTSVYAAASTLSGGNQQKVIVAREFSRPVKLLIASQPTRGLDVGSIEYIHSRIVQKRDEGVAVLLVSPELDEIMALADRIIVFYRGEIIGELSGAEATRTKLGLLMAGLTADPAERQATTATEGATD